MDRISSSSSSSSSVNRSDTPNLLSLPEENIISIISYIGKADNQSLSSVVQTCTDLWRIAGVDALLSFFYAAKSTFETADNSRKVAIFSMLTDWIEEISPLIPDESCFNILDQLSVMAYIDTDHETELFSMHKSLSTLLNKSKAELEKHVNVYEGNNEDDASAVSSLKFSKTTTRLSNCYSQVCEHISTMIYSQQKEMNDMITKM